MVDWSKFRPADFEYDFGRDKLAEHGISFEEAAQAKKLSEREIDDLVIQEARDEAAWEAPVKVKPSMRTSFSLPGELAARAAFLARIHHIKRVEEWLTRVIRERIELEEFAFAQAKREISEGSIV